MRWKTTPDPAALEAAGQALGRFGDEHDRGAGVGGSGRRGSLAAAVASRARCLHAARWIAGLSSWLLLCGHVGAAEILIQNDSVVNNGQATIVGDFIPGEHAGVVLTSPCAGNIVAVQILWLEGTPGHTQSLERAIHIYDGGNFPSPGGVLETLSGPVMTPGVWNEFRWLDQAQTIPLIVPVTSGQDFYVTLEFDNPTDVGNGGPSVVRDLDGCQVGRNALYADLGAGWMWNNFCIFLAGDLAIRAVIDCPAPTGACCYANGNCTGGIEEGACLAEFGAVWHAGQACGQVPCTPRGACCRMGGCLQLVDPAVCEGPALQGLYAGDGTNCNDGVCVLGACCQITGQCTENFVFECDALGGTFQVGTACSPNPCPQPDGACCFGTFCLAGQTSASCTGSGGVWVGPFTDCGPPDPCLPVDPCDGVSFTPGDVNSDGVANSLDIAAYTAEFLSPTPGSIAFCAANLCGGPDLDGDDVAAFAACLLDPGTCGSPNCP